MQLLDIAATATLYFGCGYIVFILGLELAAFWKTLTPVNNAPAQAIAAPPEVKAIAATAPYATRSEKSRYFTELPAPLFPEQPYLLPAAATPIALLPAARPRLVHAIAPFKRRQAQPNWATLSPAELRKECQQRGIRWRDAHGKSKHLKKSEMVAALRLA